MFILYPHLQANLYSFRTLFWKQTQRCHKEWRYLIWFHHTWDAYEHWFYISVMIDDKEEMRLRDFHQYVYSMMNKASASVWLEKGKHQIKVVFKSSKATTNSHQGFYDCFLNVEYLSS